jgi:hypothetical protein
LYNIKEEAGTGGGWMDVESHTSIASLKNDLSISFAWGLPHNPSFQEAWHSGFADSEAASAFIDFFYNGVLVYRDVLVSVDGGQCDLPLPDLVGELPEERLVVPQPKYRFFFLLDRLQGRSRFAEYFKKAGFKKTFRAWMT